jgi:hypothetical protein
MSLATDQPVALLHAHHFFHLGKNRQRFQGMMRALVADGADDHAFHPSHHAGIIAKFLDFPENGGFFLRFRSGFQYNNHFLMGFKVLRGKARDEKEKAAATARGLRVRFEITFKSPSAGAFRKNKKTDPDEMDRFPRVGILENAFSACAEN